jgi:hypothetical protein
MSVNPPFSVFEHGIIYHGATTFSSSAPRKIDGDGVAEERAETQHASAPSIYCTGGNRRFLQQRVKFKKKMKDER